MNRYGYLQSKWAINGSSYKIQIRGKFKDEQRLTTAATAITIHRVVVVGNHKIKKFRVTKIRNLGYKSREREP